MIRLRKQTMKKMRSKKISGLKDALGDNFDDLQKPRLFVKLSSFDGRREIISEVKHNSTVAKYFADQSRASCPTLSAILDELSSQAELEKDDCNVAIRERQRSISDSPVSGYCSNNTGQSSGDIHPSEELSHEERRFVSGYDSNSSITSHHQNSSQYRPNDVYESHAYGYSQTNGAHLHDLGIESDLYERSYLNVAGAVPGYSYYHHQHGMPYSPSMPSPQYYPMWPVPPYFAYGPGFQPSPGWPVSNSYFYGNNPSQDQHMEVAISQDVEDIEDRTTHNAAREQSPQTETETITSVSSDSSGSAISNDQFHGIAQRRYGVVVPANSGENSDLGSLHWVELVPSEDKDGDGNPKLIAKDSAGSSQQRSWNRAPASRSRLFSGGSGSQLDIIEENINEEQRADLQAMRTVSSESSDSQSEENLSEDEHADSQLTLTVSSDASDVEQHSNEVEVVVETMKASCSDGNCPDGGGIISERSPLTTSPQMAQKAALSSSSRTCLSTVDDEGTTSHPTVVQKRVVNDTTVTNTQTEIHVSTEVDVLSKLCEREQCLLHDKAELEQNLENMVVAAEESKAKLWQELEAFKSATQAEQDELTQTIADLKNEEKQLVSQLEEETLAWEEKLRNLNTSEYDEILLELNHKDDCLKSEADTLTHRQREIDELHASIQRREEALVSIRQQVAQTESEIDKHTRTYHQNSLETEKEISRQKALIARREMKPSHKLSKLQKEITKLKQELEEVNSDCSAKGEISTCLQSDAAELQQENERLEGQVLSLRSQLPVVLSQLEQYEKRYKGHKENNSRSIIYRLVTSQPSVTPTFSSGSLLFDVTQLDRSFNSSMFLPNMVRPRRGSRLLAHDQ